MNCIGYFIFLTQLVFVLSEDSISYKNYRVYEVSEKGFDIPKLIIPFVNRKLSVLQEHHEFDENNKPITVRSYLIPERDEKAFVKVLNLVRANYNVSIRDLESEIQGERLTQIHTQRSAGTKSVTQHYLSYDEISEYLIETSKILNKHSLPLAELEPIGKSYEERQMYLVKISSDHSAQKPIIFFEAGIHAREWTAPAAALYMIDQLVTNFTYNSKILEDVDFYIIPLSNPDGYEYSRTKDRLWRKTRSFYRGYYGVDGNRNFGYHWGERGTSSEPDSDIFKGPCPFSEAETRNVRDAGIKYKGRIIAFVSIHAYGPFIVYPWSYKRMPPAPYADVMEKIAKDAIKAIEQYNGTRYKQGISAHLMYEAAGGSDDYFKGVLGVDLSFTLELSSARKISFIIPPNEIEGIVAEAFEGFKVIASGASKHHRNVLQKKDFIKSSI